MGDTMTTRSKLALTFYAILIALAATGVTALATGAIEVVHHPGEHCILSGHVFVCWSSERPTF